MNIKVKIVFCAVSLVIFGACRSEPESKSAVVVSNQANLSTTTVNSAAPVNADAAVKNDGKEGAHEHSAPHGGTLIVFGEEFAHLEIVLDAAAGRITAYALDGEAEKSVALAQDEIEIEVGKPQKLDVKLEAVANALTGEKVGATSEFRGADERLKNLNEFDAKIKVITIRRREFKNVHFNYPKGNENTHKH